MPRPGAVEVLRAAGVGRGTPVAVVAVPGVGVALAHADTGWAWPAQAAAVLAEVESALAPRWVWWSAHGGGTPLTGPPDAPGRATVTAATAATGVSGLPGGAGTAGGSGGASGWRGSGATGRRRAPAQCWDLAAVHRLLHGGGRDDPGVVWAAARGLAAPPPPPRVRRDGQLDLLAALEDDPRERPGSQGPRAPDAPRDAPAGDRRDAPAGDPREAWPAGGRPEDPVGPDGQLRPVWVQETLLGLAPGGLATRLERAARFARLALTVRAAQERALRALADPRARPSGLPLAVLTARAESGAELLAHELWRYGLPVDRPTAEATIAGLVGPRPRDEAGQLAARRARDAPVLRHLGGSVDLRNPASVRAGLAAVGIDVPDTRSWRLTALRAAHPAVDALLVWRRAERVATTYGFRWLDEHVGADGRLRGEWRGSDGAAGRMTAAAGLHNLPADLRVVVVAEPGHQFVRADLGQIEPRVLAVVSGDRELAAATGQDDLYAPVAARLGVDRPTAKVAVLAAMYGQTSGTAGQALRQMRRSYPVALAYLDAAESAGRAAARGGSDGPPLRTFGGRRLPLRTGAAGTGGGTRSGTAAVAGVDAGAGAWAADDRGPDPGAVGGADPDRAAAAWGRFARNAVIQGSAAELFKAWAVTVRQLLVPLGGEIVLCLHDELLLHVPTARAVEAVAATRGALESTAAYWAAGSDVRFVADITVVGRWSDAKS
ncbi:MULTISPECIES: DNA polymerase [Parafrankia]|nr:MULTISPECIES: DNA polymerase [Parafrankia]MBE3200688.1 DNA polymerase I [Parafrankia sp. CH37]